MKFTRILSLILAVLLMACTFVACDMNKDADPTTDDGADQKAEPITLNVVESSYTGYTIIRDYKASGTVLAPTLPAPVPKNQILRRIGIPTTFTRHSELFDNFLLLPKYTKQQFLSSCHCDRATRTPTLPYSPITRTSTQTLFLVYHGLEQSPANP